MSSKSEGIHYQNTCGAHQSSLCLTFLMLFMNSHSTSLCQCENILGFVGHKLKLTFSLSVGNMVICSDSNLIALEIDKIMDLEFSRTYMKSKFSLGNIKLAFFCNFCPSLLASKFPMLFFFLHKPITYLNSFWTFCLAWKKIARPYFN